MVDPNEDDESLIEQSQEDVRNQKAQNGLNKIADQAIKKASKKVTNKLAQKGASKAVTSALLPIMPYIIIAVVIIIVIILIIGIIAYFRTMPGMLSGKLNAYVQKVSDRIQTLYEDQSEAFVNDNDVIELANYLSDMGYDLVGEGFVDPVTTETYKNVDKLIEDGYKIVTVEDRIYLAKDEDDFSTYYTDKFYYSTGALYNGFDTSISDKDSLKDGAGTEAGLMVKDPNNGYTKNGITYSDNNKITKIVGNTDLLRNYLIADKKNYFIRNYDIDLLTKLGKTLKEIWTGKDSPSWTKGSLELFVSQKGNANFLYNNGLEGWVKSHWTNSKISVVGSKLKIKAGWFNNPMYFEMDGWSGRYGLSKDFLISLHLATLSPELVETMAQTFDTRIQVYMDFDDKAKVDAYYKTDEMEDYVTYNQIKEAIDDSAWPFDGLFVSKKEAKQIMEKYGIKSMSTGRYACCGENGTEVLYGSGNGNNRISGSNYNDYINNELDWYDNVLRNQKFVDNKSAWATKDENKESSALIFSVQEDYGIHNRNNHGDGNVSLSFHKKMVYVNPAVAGKSITELEVDTSSKIDEDAQNRGIDVGLDDEDGNIDLENNEQSNVLVENSKFDQLSKVDSDITINENVSSRDDSQTTYDLNKMKYTYPASDDINTYWFDVEYYSNSNYFRVDKMGSVLNMLNKYYVNINSSNDLNIVEKYTNTTCPLNPITAFECDNNDVPLIEKYIPLDDLKNLKYAKNDVMEIEIVSWPTNDSGLTTDDPAYNPDEDGSIILSLVVRRTSVDNNYDFAAIAYRTKSYSEMGGVAGNNGDLCSEHLDDIKGVCSNCRRYISDVKKGLAKIADEDFTTYQPYISRVVGSWFRDTYFIIPNSVDDGVKAILDDDIGYSKEELTGSTVNVIKNDEQFLKETGELWTKYLYDNNYSNQDYALFVMNSKGEYLESESDITNWKEKYSDDKLNEILKETLNKLNNNKSELEEKINNSSDSKEKEEYQKQLNELEEKIKNVNSDIEVIKTVRDNYISYLEYDSKYYYGYLDVKGISEDNELKEKNIENIFNEYDIALEKMPETQTIDDIEGVEGFSGWSAYNFDSKPNESILPVEIDEDSPKYISRIYYAYNNSKKNEEENYQDESVFYYKLQKSYNITQEKDAQRGMTNPKVKYLFKNKKYYKYDGTLERANQIYADWNNIKDYYLNSAESWDDVLTKEKAKLFARTTIKSFWFGPLGLIESMNKIDDNKDNLKLSVLDGYIDNIYYNDIDDELFDFARDFDNDGIADIASPNVINKTEYNGLQIAESTIKTLDPRNPNLISNIDIGTESLEMFSILENTHTQDADYAYRDLKELFCELNYFDKEDLTEPAKEVLEWILPESGSTGWPNRAFDKKLGEYGSYIHTEEMAKNLSELISISDGAEESSNGSGNSSASSFNGAEKDTPIVIPATGKILEMGVTTVQNETTEDLLKTITVIDDEEENAEKNKNGESNLYVTPEIENAIEKAAKEKEEDNKSSFGKEYKTGYIKLEVICDDESSTDESSINQMKAAVDSVGLDTAFIDDFYNDYRQESTKKSICDGYVIYIEGIDFRLNKQGEWTLDNSIINNLVKGENASITNESGETKELQANYYTKKIIPRYYPKATKDKLEEAENRKEAAPSCVSVTENGETSEIFLKAGTLIGTAGDANIRIIMKDKDDAVVENVEDYLELDDKNNSLQTDLTKFFFLPYEGGGLANAAHCCVDTSDNDGKAGVAVGICSWTTYENGELANVQNLFEYIVKQEPKFSALKKYGASATGSDIYKNINDISKILADLDEKDHDRLLELQLQYASQEAENKIKDAGLEWLLDRSDALIGTYMALANWVPNPHKGAWADEISPDKSDRNNIISLMKAALTEDMNRYGYLYHYGRFNSQCRLALDILEGKITEEEFNLWMMEKISDKYGEGQNSGYIEKLK